MPPASRKPEPQTNVLDISEPDATVVLTDGDDRRETTLQTVARSGGTIALVLQLDGTEATIPDLQTVASHLANGNELQMPAGLVINDDGTLLNWRGTNYVPQPAPPYGETQTTTTVNVVNVEADPQAVPEYVERLLDGLLGVTDSLDFRGAPVPDRVRRRLTDAVLGGQITQLRYP